MALLSNRARVFLGCEIGGMVVGVVFVGCRLLVVGLGKGRRGFGLSNLFCVQALVFLLAYGAVWSVACFHGVGLHDQQLDTDQMTIILKLFYSSKFSYYSAVIFMRLSILFVYLALIPQKPFIYWAYVIGAIACLWPFVLLVYSFESCVPMSKNWDPVELGHCGRTVVVELVSIAGDAVSDFMLMLMPTPIIWRIQTSTKEKLVVLAICCLAFATLAVNIARVILPVVNKYNDFAYFTVNPVILATAEILCGILISSVPIFIPIFDYTLSKLYDESCSRDFEQAATLASEPALSSPHPPPAETHLFGDSFNNIDFPERQGHNSGTSSTLTRTTRTSNSSGVRASGSPLVVITESPVADIRRSYSGSTAAGSVRGHGNSVMMEPLGREGSDSS